MRFIKVIDTRGVITWVNPERINFVQQHGGEVWINYENGTVITHGSIEQVFESSTQHQPENNPAAPEDPKLFSKLRKIDAANAWIISPDCPSGFESKFLESITIQFKNDGDLTEKQEEGLDNLIRKFKIDVEKYAP